MYVPMAFRVCGADMTYEPLSIPNQYSEISDMQAKSIFRKYKVWPRVLYKKDWGIWIGSTRRRQCRHAEDEVYHVYPTRYVPNRRGL